MSVSNAREVQKGLIFGSLPVEMKQKCFSYLSIGDLSAVNRVSWDFHVCSNRMLKRAKCIFERLLEVREQVRQQSIRIEEMLKELRRLKEREINLQRNLEMQPEGSLFLNRYQKVYYFKKGDRDE